MKLISRMRTSALRMAASTGAFSMVQSSHWRRRRLCILCYHGISLADEHEWRPGLYMTAHQFGDRLDRLRALGANVLPLGESLRRLHDGTLPEAAVAITFDDGGHDFYINALPLLERAGLPGTVYLTTYYAEAATPILSLAVDYLLWKARARPLLEWPALGLNHEETFESPNARRALGHRIASAMRGLDLSRERRAELLLELAERLGESPRWIQNSGILRIMPPDEVADCARRGIDFQLHTHRHRMPRDRDLLLKELSDNRAVLHRLTGRTPAHLCYPSGDYDPSLFPWLAEAGVESATTCDVALAKATSHRYMLPRFLDTALQPGATFEGWVTGAAAFVSRPPHGPGRTPLRSSTPKHKEDA